jgi:hypothetical protein
VNKYLGPSEAAFLMGGVRISGNMIENLDSNRQLNGMVMNEL